MSPLKIVFSGTPEFALPCLKALLESVHEITAVYTQPDRPAGRGRKLQLSAVKQLALEHNIPVFQPLNFKDEQTVEQLAALKPDVMVVIAYGLILPKTVLAIPRLGCINVHGSLLPRWRGASPIQQAVLHGDTESGVTLMQMDAGMDTGDILSLIPCRMDSEETSKTLHDKLSVMAAEPLLNTLEALATGTATPRRQDSASATYAPKIQKEEARIDWQKSAALIHQAVRAYNPWPVAWTETHGEIVRIHEARVAEGRHGTPGEVLALDKAGMLVAAGKDALLITRLQFSGGKVLAVKDWLNSPNLRISLHQIFK